MATDKSFGKSTTYKSGSYNPRIIRVKKTGLVYSDIYLKHRTKMHPERKERLEAIISRLSESGPMDDLVPIEPYPAEIDSIARIHTRGHIDFVKESCERGAGALDADTMVCPDSYEAALLAVGGVLAAVDAVISGNVDNAFCAVRPPGHHAEFDRAMGFCLFNNIAVGARYAQDRYDCGRVLIIDWDAHHGNGTCNSFIDDPTVFYFSIHQYPHYPGTGRGDETGKGAGQGFTLNVPLPGGAGDAEYVEIFKQTLAPKIREFAPDIILISAGFDAHKSDPLASMNVSSRGFSELTRIVCDLADKLCGGKIVSVLEGGYDLDALSQSVEFHIREMMK
jgi:acetoin utilization deacetylase AcuC-like enzyme